MHRKLNIKTIAFFSAIFVMLVTCNKIHDAKYVATNISNGVVVHHGLGIKNTVELGMNLKDLRKTIRHVVRTKKQRNFVLPEFGAYFSLEDSNGNKQNKILLLCFVVDTPILIDNVSTSTYKGYVDSSDGKLCFNAPVTLNDVECVFGKLRHIDEYEKPFDFRRVDGVKIGGGQNVSLHYFRKGISFTILNDKVSLFSISLPTTGIDEEIKKEHQGQTRK